MTGDPLLPTPLLVKRVVKETPDAVTLVLDASGREGGFPFEPGQFAMLYAFGVGEIPLSVSGDPARPAELLHTVRAVGAVSAALCALKKGAQAGVRGPFGVGWPLDQARGRDVILLAGGLGLAPLRPAVYHLLRHRADYGRIALLVGARTPENLLFTRELASWGRRAQVRVTVDRVGPEWTGDVGPVLTLLSRAEFDPANAMALVCGPEIMMRFSARALLERGLSPERIYLSMERSMKCAVGHCGHCLWGPYFVCKDGPVFAYGRVASLLGVREV